LVVVTLTLGLLGSVVGGASARSDSQSWQLVDYQQSACFSSNVTSGYYAIFIDGLWKRALNIGITGLPPGGTFTTSYAPIPPGSSDGIYSLAYVGVHLPSNTAVGTYTADLWAGNRLGTKSVPVTIVVKAKCGY
jgi:hypothetical protein